MGRFLRRQADLAISDLVEVELVSAIARKVRRGEMRRVDAQRAQAVFLGHLDTGFYARWPISRAHFSTARDWLSFTTLPLLALDALHLAVAAGGSAPIATIDAALARAARALGVGVRIVPR